jgi:hypothetical protein
MKERLTQKVPRSKGGLRLKEEELSKGELRLKAEAQLCLKTEKLSKAGQRLTV